MPAAPDRRLRRAIPVESAPARWRSVGILVAIGARVAAHRLSGRVENLERHRPGGGRREVVVDDRAVRRIRAGRFVRRQRRVGVRVPAHAIRRLRLEQALGLGTGSWLSSWRSGVMSSRIQKPRPCVPTTRSSSWTTRSRIERRRHVQPQRLPVVAVVEARRRPRARCRRTAGPCVLGSSRTALTGAPSGMPLTISVQVLPPSCVR